MSKSFSVALALTGASLLLTPGAHGAYCTNASGGHFWADNCANPNVTVTRSDVSFCGSGAVTIGSGQHGLDILISPCPGAGTIWTVTIARGANAPPPRIGDVTVDVPAGATVELTLAVGEGAVGDVHSVVNIGAGTLKFSGEIVGSLGEVGETAVVADLIGVSGFIVREDVHGDILLRGPGIASRNQCPGLQIDGNFNGSLYAQGGAIDFLSVGDPLRPNITGRIGTPGFPVRIEAFSDINFIVAGEINAYVIAGQGNPGQQAPLSNVGYVEVSRLRGSGNFTGSILGESIDTPAHFTGLFPTPGRQIIIEGDMGGAFGASIIVQQPLINYIQQPPDGTDGVTRRIVIGGSFSNGIIQLPANGLQGQILIGARNQGGQWGFGASVQMNAPSTGGSDIVLTSPLYPALPGTFGGGGVGEAPFRLHGPACAPPHNSSVLSTAVPGYPAWNGEGDPPCDYLRQFSNSISVAYVQLRGPVVFNSSGAPAGTQPVVVRRRFIGTGGEPISAWVDVTSDFDLVDAIQLDEEPAGNARNARIRIWKPALPVPGSNPPTSYRPGFGTDVEYEVTPNAQWLRCAGVTGAPLAPQFTYRFKIRFNCRDALIQDYDQNGDGILDGYDLVEWTYEPGDLNDDGQTNGADIWVLVQVIEEYEGQP